MRKAVLRLIIPLLCGMCLNNVPRANAQEPGPSGPQAVGIFAILIGVPVAVGFGIYYAAHAPHSIQGCVEDQNGSLVLTDSHAKQYLLGGKIDAIKAGERVRLSGRMHKDRMKRRAFQTKRLAADYGACHTASALP